MKLGVTIIPDGWRISPMLEASERLLVLRCCQGGFSLLADYVLPDEESRKIEFLCQSGIRILICGAAANDTCVRLNRHGIDVCPFVSGNWEDFLQDYLSTSGQVEKYVMPGCRRQHRLCCGKHRRLNEKED